MSSLEITEHGYKLENSSAVLTNVHASALCAGRPCPIHNLTDHAMRSWRQHFRDDRGIMERICPHGVGHPDPDDVFNLTPERGGGIHGCDGCCLGGKADFNRAIKAYRKRW